MQILLKEQWQAKLGANIQVDNNTIIKFFMHMRRTKLIFSVTVLSFGLKVEGLRKLRHKQQF